jgi:hypothetical protein
MTRRLWISSLTALGLVACGTPATKLEGDSADVGEVADPDAGGTHDAGGVDAGGSNDQDAGVHPVTDGGALAGLPCDVAGLLQTSCMSCHGHPTSQSAPFSITNYDELHAPAPADSSTDVAHRSLIRMRSAGAPMPPGAPLSASDIAILDHWITSGEPVGDCHTEAPDAGTPPDGGTPGEPDGGSDTVPNSPPTCTSGITWFLGDLGTDLMHPGRACIECHTSKHKGPSLSIAGTVYPSTHEPDDCNGTSSGVSVIITDAGGHTVTLSPNAAGNFRSNTSLQLPYTAKVTRNGKTRQMVSAQTSGDCNACHTQNGAQSAPGRIVAP